MTNYKTNLFVIFYNFRWNILRIITFTLLTFLFISFAGYFFYNNNDFIDEKWIFGTCGIFFTVFSFVDVSFFDYKIFVSYTSKKRYRFHLYSGISKQRLFLLNIASIFIYSFSRFIINFVGICFLLLTKINFSISDSLFLVFNIFMNNLLVTLLMAFLGLLTINYRKKYLQYIIIFLLCFILWIVVLSSFLSPTENTTINDNSSLVFYVIIKHLPLFGLSLTYNFTNWVKYSNLMFSVLSIVGLFVLIYWKYRRLNF